MYQTKPINEPTDECMKESINQPTNQATNQPANQPINQSIIQSINQSVNQSITQSRQLRATVSIRIFCAPTAAKWSETCIQNIEQRWTNASSHT